MFHQGRKSISKCGGGGGGTPHDLTFVRLGYFGSWKIVAFRVLPPPPPHPPFGSRPSIARRIRYEHKSWCDLKECIHCRSQDFSTGGGGAKRGSEATERGGGCGRGLPPHTVGRFFFFFFIFFYSGETAFSCTLNAITIGVDYEA